MFQMKIFNFKMVRSIILIFVSINFCYTAYSQSLKLEILNSSSNRVMLIRVYGSKYDTVKSVPIINNVAEFDVSRLKAGVYKADINSGNNSKDASTGIKMIDIVINKEDIVLKMDFNDPNSTLEVIKSKENSLYRKYSRDVMGVHSRLNTIEKSLFKYPDQNDSFYKNARLEMLSLKKQIIKLIENYSKGNENTFFYHIINFDLPTLIPEFVEIKGLNEYIVDNYFQETNFQDTTLFYTNVISRKVQAFFGKNMEYSKGDIEDKLINSLDIVMSNASVNNSMFSFIAKDVQYGFKSYSFDRFFAYLIENYLLTEKCTSDNQNVKSVDKLKIRLNNFKKLSEGKRAPDVVISHNDKNINLSKIDADYKLVVFWATDCSHCRAVLPQLNNLYSKYKNKSFEVIAVSMDSNKSDYDNFINKNSFSWINVANFKGWSCPIAKQFFVYATPMEYLLDRDNNIVLRPCNLDDVRNFLNEKGL